MFNHYYLLLLPRLVVSVIIMQQSGVRPSVRPSCLSNLNRPRSGGAYSTWVTSGQHLHVTRPAYIFVNFHFSFVRTDILVIQYYGTGWKGYREYDSSVVDVLTPLLSASRKHYVELLCRTSVQCQHPIQFRPTFRLFDWRGLHTFMIRATPPPHLYWT